MTEQEVNTLHTSQVDNQYAGNWNFPAMGEMAYQDGTLCWSTAEQVLCGLLVDGELTETVVMLEAEAAHSAGICTGMNTVEPHLVDTPPLQTPHHVDTFCPARLFFLHNPIR